jgi:pimeloyl-ACP methyl ester carboxylesterase
MIYATVAGLLVSAVAAIPTPESSTILDTRNIGPAGRISSFKDIPASSDLHWTPCYNRFHCSNLEVPLDYENPSLGSTVVAWIRQDAVNGTGTDILFNPGGPGGSGIETILLGGGDQIMQWTGGKYNVVSFDPRGVNASGVDLTCFPNNPAARERSAPQPTETHQEFYAAAVAKGKWCSAVNKNTTARYGSTMAVVQDMMHFTELQAVQNGKKAEEALIWYYGVSYGTVIGQTLAAVFPDRIGRIINDANVNGEKFYNGFPDTAVENTEEGMRYFFDVCHEAGPKKCAFAGNSSSAKDIEKRFNTLLKKLEEEPLPFIDPSSGEPAIMTKNAFLRLAFDVLYAPMVRFPIMAIGLDVLEKRNSTAWPLILQMAAVPSNPGPFNYTSKASSEVQQFVSALDSAGRYPIKNVTQFLKAAAKITKTSQWFGEGYADSNPLLAAGWSLLPPKSQVFPGKFCTPCINIDIL